MELFPFAEYWWFYASFLGFVLVVVALDLGVFHRKAHEVSFREASAWTLVWLSLALAFNGILYWYALGKFPAETARQVALEFLTGFVIEKSLAIDNIFVFAVIFSYFAIPKTHQHRILFFGILGALIFRGIFIAVGSHLMKYHIIVVFFGVMLMVTGLKMFLAPAEMMNPEKNLLIRALKKLFRISPRVDTGKFFLKENGVRYATPLFIALVFIEISDIIFAVDSVPAIFALTKEPLIVFTSNIFAILGLRSMYFMLSGTMERFRYIKYGLASVLVFVGLKMAWLNEAFDGKFPISWSLGIIATLIGGSIAFSWLASRKSSLALQ